MSVPDYLELARRLVEESMRSRLYRDDDGRLYAALMYRASEAIAQLTHVAHFYERKAATSIKIEQPRIVIHPLTAGFEKDFDPVVFQDYLQDLVQHYEKRYGSGCVRIETEDGRQVAVFVEDAP